MRFKIRVNGELRGTPCVRVIGADGEMLGSMTLAEALRLAVASVDEVVFEKLDSLTNSGDAKTARKHSLKPRALTSAELNWIRAVLGALTRRLGEWEYDRRATLTRITMSDLPSLDRPK